MAPLKHFSSNERKIIELNKRLSNMRTESILLLTQIIELKETKAILQTEFDEYRKNHP
jgi:hypothetical protein